MSVHCAEGQQEDRPLEKRPGEGGMAAGCAESCGLQFCVSRCLRSLSHSRQVSLKSSLCCSHVLCSMQTRLSRPPITK